MRGKSGILALTAVIAVAGAFLGFGGAAYAVEVDLSGTVGATSMTDGNTYKLTGDVTLSGRLSVAAGATVTLDLNGYTLTSNSTSWQIANGTSANSGPNGGGTLTIIDSGIPKGKISCTSNTAGVCVKTYSSAGTTIDGVTIESIHAAAKTDEGAVLHILNSTLISSGPQGTIQNFGTVDVSNSVIINTNASGSAVQVLNCSSPTCAEGVFDSSATVTNSTIDAAVAASTNCGSDPTCTSWGVNDNTTAENSIEISGGTISAGATFDILANNNTPAEVGITGVITAPITALEYATSGATITLNGDVTGGTYTVPAGVTLVIPDAVAFENVALTVNGSVQTAAGEELKMNSDGTYSVVLTQPSAGSTAPTLTPPESGILAAVSNSLTGTIIAILVALAAASGVVILTVKFASDRR
jgi:hypothetical protein